MKDWPVNNEFVKLRRRQQGFLMIGVVVAIVIITTGMVAVGGMFIKAAQLNSCAKHYLIATNLAQQQMEHLKQTFQYPTTTYRSSDYPITTSATASDSEYLIFTEAKLIDVEKKTVQVTVTVSWTENGKQCSVNFMTYCLRDILIYPAS